MKNNKRKVFYEVDPRYFKDGTGEGKGNLKGLYNNMEYFANLGVDVLIIQNILSSLNGEDSHNFTGVDKELGEVNMLKAIISIGKVNNIEVVVELPIATINENHTWFKSAEAQNNSDFTEIIKLYSKRKVQKETSGYKYSEHAKGFYSIDESTQEIPLNWKSEQVLNQFKEVIKYWRDLGISGFIFKEFEYLTDDRREEFMNRSTLRELRKLYRAVKEIDDRLYSIGKSIMLNPSEVKKYTSGSTKVFDYFISENISLLGASKKYGTDLIGKFKTRELAALIKTYAKNESHILGFGSELTGRVNSRWGDHGEYWAESAKSIALILMMNPSSPLIYYADEIGTLNIGLTHLDDFMDETLEERKKKMMASRIKEEDFMDAQVLQNPINSHSSMAWSDEEHAGFTWAEKISWPVPYTYREINVSKQYNDEESVLNFYKRLNKLIKTGKNAEIISKGVFSINSLIPGLFRMSSTLGDKELITYVNLTDKSKKIRKLKEGQVIFTSYSYKKYKELPLVLGAYESIVVTKDTDEAIKNTQLIALGKIKEVEAKERMKQEKILDSKRAEEDKVQKEIAKIEKERTEKLKKAMMASETKDKTVDVVQFKKQKDEERKIQKELIQKAINAKEQEKTKLFELKKQIKKDKVETKKTDTREINVKNSISKTQTIKVNNKEEPKRNKTQTIRVNNKEEPKRNKTQTIKVNNKEEPKRNKTQTIRVNNKEEPKRNKTQTIKVNNKEEPKRNKTQTIKVNNEQNNTEINSHSFSISNIFKKDIANKVVNPENTISFKIGNVLNKVTSIFKKEPMPQTRKAKKAIIINDKAREEYNSKLINAKPDEIHSIKEKEKIRQFEFRETLRTEREIEKTKELEIRQKEIFSNKKAHEVFEKKLEKAKPEQIESLKEKERTRQFEFSQAYKEERIKERQREHDLRIKAKEMAREAKEHEKTQIFELRKKAREDRIAQKRKLFEERQKEREQENKIKYINNEEEELEKTKQLQLKKQEKEKKLFIKQQAREDAIKAVIKAKEEKAKADLDAAKAKAKAIEAKERAEIEATRTKEIELKAAKIAEEKAKIESEKFAKKELEAKAKADEEAKKIFEEEKRLAEKEAEKEKKLKEVAEQKKLIQKEKEIQEEVKKQEAIEAAEKVEKERKAIIEEQERKKSDAKIAKLKEKQEIEHAKTEEKKAKAKAKENAKMEKELKKKLAIEQKLVKAQEKEMNHKKKIEKAKAMKLAKARSKVEVDNSVLETEFTEDDMTSLLEEELAGTTQIDMDDVDSFISMNKKKK